MISFTATLEKFDSKGEKTGWTYITVPAKIAASIKPATKRSFRVKGKMDDHCIRSVALIPMGDGNFILAVNAAMRKAIRKIHGAKVKMQLEEDKAVIKMAGDLTECFKDEPEGFRYFNSLPQSHRNWYSNWVKGAKTDTTRSKRIAAVIKACSLQMSFGEMMRQYRDDRKLPG